jgi:isoleucyl-tRNA synthetase
MLTNAQPWDNLKFDEEGIKEVQRKFFGTLYNTYNFFALYANIDKFTYKEPEIPIANRPEIDRWILSELNTLVKNCDANYSDYEPTKAGRDIQQFVDEYLSNWYVRLCRRRFWKGEYSEDKISAYQTLYMCMITIAKLASPIAPFFMDKLFLDLNKVTLKENVESIHLTDFPKADKTLIDKLLEEKMQLAQQICSMVLSLRKKSNIRVRQPLQKIMIPILESSNFVAQIEKVKPLILHEVNVKEIQFVEDSEEIFVKKIKPNFKNLGPKYGKIMKAIAAKMAEFTQKNIEQIEKEEHIILEIEGEKVDILLSDVEIIAEDISGWVVTNQGALTVALDIIITKELKEEGYARELVNRIQNYRKDSDLEVTDTIAITLQSHTETDEAFRIFEEYIKLETLCKSFEIVPEIYNANKLYFEIVEGVGIDALIF